MTETRKLLSLFTGITFVAFLAFQTMSMTNVSATYGGGDSCNQEFTYIKDEDFDDNRIDINITSFSGDNDRRVIINPSTGYSLTFIGIDWTGSDANEATPSVGNGSDTITYDAPDNQSIDNVTVKVKKVCVTPTLTPTVTPRPTTIPTVIPTAIPTAVPTTAPTQAPTAVPTSIPSITPMVTISTDQNETPSVSPEPTVTAVPTVTPTDTPSSSSSNNNSSSNNSSSNNEVKVAGISALASTGGIIDSLMNSVFVSGLLTFAFGLKRHGKKS